MNLVSAEGLRARIDAALHELGEPGPGYPAPVANAVDILRAALRSESATPDHDYDDGRHVIQHKHGGPVHIHRLGEPLGAAYDDASLATPDRADPLATYVPQRDESGYLDAEAARDAALLANAILGGSSYLPHREAAERIIARDTDRASTEGLRAALFDCYVLLPPERLDLLRDETKQTIDAAAALRDTGPRPDSGIDGLRGLMEAADEEERTESARRKRYPRLSWEVETDRHAFYEACISYVRARLSTPRTETSE